MDRSALALFAAPCALGKPAAALRQIKIQNAQRAPRVQSQRTVRCTVAAEGSLADALESVPSGLRGSLLHLPDDAEITDLGTRHTKIIATIGPATADFSSLLQLAAGGMNMARLNMSHGNYDWHRQVIDHIRTINLTSPFIIGIMVDLGSLDSVRLGEFLRNPVLAKGDKFTLTTRHEPSYPSGVSEVSIDEFLSIADVGDLITCQAEGGGVVQLLVDSISEFDVNCTVVSPGTLASRGNITIRGKSFNVNADVKNEDLNTTLARSVLGCPPEQLEFAIQQRVEYVSLSFVESPDQILAVKRLLVDRGANIGVIAKIESPNALDNLDAIVAAADAVMIARGDLGASLHYEKVPYWQEQTVLACRRHGKQSMVSTHFLESMVLYPTPTRAEVADMTEAVKQRTDALVLTAETASGRFPFKSLSTMHAVLHRVQRRIHETKVFQPSPPLITDPNWWTPQVGDIAETIARSAALLASQRSAKAILVFTQKGLMASLMSRYRPRAPIFAFTPTPTVRNKLNLMYGVRPFRVVFEDDPEETIHNAMEILKERKTVENGDLVLILADVLGGREGANEDETRAVFDRAAKGSRFISANEVRNALRRLGMKVSDKIEAQLGMRDVDVKDADFEMELKNEKKSLGHPDNTAERFDYERFRKFVAQAKEIVHTLQMRYVD